MGLFKYRGKVWTVSLIVEKLFNGRFDCGYIGYTVAYNKREVQDKNKHMYLGCCADYI